MSKIALVAGEVSGDRYGADLIRELAGPNIQFTGLGGPQMQAAGMHLLFNLAEHGVTGFTEVIRLWPVIHKSARLIKHYLITEQPDCLILIDYPGFNLRLAKFAKKLGIPVIYYISPQIWAWKPGRIKTIQQTVDHMAVILPFEKPIYQQAGVPVSFVGHPLLNQIKITQTLEAFRAQYGFKPDSTIIGLLPGSRQNEIQRLLPLMLETAELLYKKYPNLEFALPLTNNAIKLVTKLPIKLIQNNTHNTMHACHSLLIASGTATLEATLIGTPMVLVYKTSWLTYLFAKCLLKINYIGLSNLLAGKEIIPELIQHHATAKNCYQQLEKYLLEKDYYQKTQAELNKIKLDLSTEQADEKLSQLIKKLSPHNEGIIR